MKKKYAIAFIFIEEIHHLYHFITIAIELSKQHKVTILTYPKQNSILEKTLEKLGEHQVKVERRQTLFFRAFTDKLKKRKIPRAGFWMKKNYLYILNSFDAVVFSDYNHHKLLQKRKSDTSPKFIKIPHGIAGREYVYKKDLLDFDFHLIFGKFYATELKKRKLLTNHAIIGYPKLEVIEELNKEKIFNNTKKTVVYNPHFTAKLSSWYSFGINILDYFYNQEEYNLIFAPHINLFNKKGGDNPNNIPKKYFNADHIHIDLGSEKSVDMTYVLNADIYVGDVSSQVFEFILNPKPAIFINAHQINYKNNSAYRLWKIGQVVNNMNQFKEALHNAFFTLETYIPIQEKINEGNISRKPNTKPSQRATEALIQFLNENE